MGRLWVGQKAAAKLRFARVRAPRVVFKDEGMTRQNKITNTSLALAALLLGTLGSACDAGSSDDDGETGEAESGEAESGEAGDGDGDSDLLKLGGSYTDEWESSHVIDDLTWQHGSARYGITQFDNAAQFVIAQNGSANEFDPDKWSRFDFTYVENTLYYCQTAFNAEAEADALAATPADATDPAVAGCGGMFAWTKLADTAFELEGSYTDQYSGSHAIDTTNWATGSDTFAFTQFDSQADFAIAEIGRASCRERV